MYELRSQPTFDQVVGVVPPSPIDGVSVVYDKPFFVSNPPYRDPLSARFAGREMLSAPVNLRALCNAQAYGSGVSQHLRYGGRLYQNPREIEMFLESVTLKTAPLMNAWSLFSGRWEDFSEGKHYVPTSITGENPVIHENLFGSVSSVFDMSTPAPFRRDGTDVLWTGMKLVQLNPAVISRQLPVFDVSLTGMLEAVLRNDVTEELSGLDAENPNIIRAYPDYGWRMVSTTKYQVEYHYGIQQNEPLGVTRMDVNWFAIRFTFELVPFEIYPMELEELAALSNFTRLIVKVEWTPGVFVWCSPIGLPGYPALMDAYYQYRDRLPANRWEDWSSRQYYHEETLEGTVGFATDPQRTRLSEYLGWNEAESRYSSYDPGTFLDFCSWSNQVLKESVSAVSLSYMDAVEKALEVFEANHVELLAELGDILAPIDVLRMAYELPRFLGKKAVMLLGILDLVADTYLLTKFALAPTIDDAIDVSRRAKAFRERILKGDAFKAQTTHGKCVVVLEEDNLLGVPPCKVVLRSKVRLKEHPDSLLTAAIGLDSVGLLPTGSAVWDTIPGSFLVDWFFPVGDAVSMVEKQAKVLLLGCTYCVHTISIEHRFSDEVLATLGYADSGDAASGGVGYRKFVRTVDRRVPILGPTRLPVLRQPGIPDFGIAGSLIYKSFR